MDNTDRFINLVKKRKILYRVTEGIIISFTTTLALLVYLALFDYLLPLPGFVRFFFVSFIVLILTFFSIRIIQTTKTKQENIIYEIQNKFPELEDSLINAWQLHNNLKNFENLGMSEALAEKHIEKVNDKISGLQYKKTVDFNRLYKYSTCMLPVIFITIACYFKTPGVLTENLPKFLLISNTLSFNNYIDVFPGDTKLPLGSDIEISMTPRMRPAEYMQFQPQLYVKSREDDWHEMLLSLSANNNSFVSNKIHMVSDMEYYIKWKGLKSQKYLIECVPVPKPGEFKLTYHFPSYTGLAPKEGKMFGEIPLLAGTNIEFSADVNKKLKKAFLITSYGRKIPLRYKETLYSKKVDGNIIVEKEGECWFELVPEDDIVDLSPAHYALHVSKDKDPDIVILSPAQDLVVGQDVHLKIVYRANDDFGISNVELSYKLNSSDRNVQVKRSPGSSEFTDEYDWDISKINTKPGDKIEYSVKVADNDTISGPKTAYSDKYTLEIFSYETEHAKIEEELKNIREEMMNLLGDQTNIKELVENMLKEGHVITPEELKNALENQNKINDRTKQLTEKLGKTLKRMENDPYINYQIYQEYKQINNSLDYLSNNQMPQASNSMAKQDMGTANKNIDEIINSLEKLNLLAEDILQYQRMQDVLNSGDKLSELTDELKKGLEGPADPQKMEQYKKMLDKIDKLLAEINEELKNMPKDLPEEFINQPGVKQIDTAQMQSLSDSIRSALQSGNFEQAFQQAQKLLKQLESMRDTLQQASKSVGFNSVNEALNKRMRESMLELGAIISGQEQVISETQMQETQRQKKVGEEEDKILEKLAKKQKEALNKVITLRTECYKTNIRQFPPVYDSHLRISMPLMERVYDELCAKRVVKSKEYLRDIIMQLEFAASITDDFSARISSTQAGQSGMLNNIRTETINVKNIEQEILDILNKPVEIELSNATKDKLAEIAKKQSGIKSRTINLDRSIQEMSRQTAAINPEISSRLKLASHEMEKAEENLNASKINPALTSQQKALEYLTQGDSSMQNAQQAMGQMQVNFNQPMAGFMQTQPGKDGSSGYLGVKNGRVKLPEINDYLPPKEFREEIVAALKEKYPEKYEKIIKEYYNKLIQ